MTKPKILTFDIETMANLVWSWDIYTGNGWRAIDTELEWYPLSFGAKWVGGKAKYFALEDYRGYKPVIKRNRNGSTTLREPNIRPLMKDMWNLLDEADIIVGFNSKSFDIKKLNDKFLDLNMKPYSPVFHVDVMREKKKLTKSNSNSLKYTAEKWGISRKLDNDGFPLWVGCAEGNKKSQKLMKEYCLGDIEATEQAYLYLRPWMESHPNMANLSGVDDACPSCQNKTLTRSGVRKTKSGTYPRYFCTSCSSWSRGRTMEPENPKPLAV